MTLDKPKKRLVKANKIKEIAGNNRLGVVKVIHKNRACCHALLLVLPIELLRFDAEAMHFRIQRCGKIIQMLCRLQRL